MQTWESSEGVVDFPSGRKIRGRSWKERDVEPADLTVLLTTVVPNQVGSMQSPLEGDLIVIDWPDDRTPRRPAQARADLRTAWERAATEKVEIVCNHGISRTGTALATIAVFDGMEPREAMEWVRETYHPEAVGTHALRGFVLELEVEVA